MKIVIAVMCIVVLMSACKQEPVPDLVAVTGDSVTLQSLLYAENSHGWDTAEKVGLGWRAEHAQPRVDADVRGEETSPEILAIVFGHNYSQGFGNAEAAEVTDMVNAPHEDACVVIVLPHYEGSSTTHAQAIEDYRGWMSALGNVRDRTVVVDWRPIVQAHPEYLEPDGVHLPMQAAWYEPTNTMIEAAEAYQAVISGGITQCQEQL